MRGEKPKESKEAKENGALIRRGPTNCRWDNISLHTFLLSVPTIFFFF